MDFNENISFLDIGDPFSQEEVAEELSYTPLYLEDARKKGPISQFVVDSVLPKLPDWDSVQGKLGLRNDHFSFGGRPTQPLHFDPPISSRGFSRGPQGLIAFGKGTGKTAVLRAFRTRLLSGLPANMFEAGELTGLINEDVERYPFDVFETGTLVVSHAPFVHGRVETNPGFRIALDFGILAGRVEPAAWEHWE